jgi:hypothetical protein
VRLSQEEKEKGGAGGGGEELGNVFFMNLK